ncbi:MAG TPA: hypothetical protein PKC28_05540 [Bdellovibrionales bacterium]|nr:hypothetical protein [Bdellovibrionales bacterium]
MSRLVTCLLMILGLAACSTAPTRLNDVKEGHWKARALIKDKDQSRSYIVNLNMNAVRDQNVRMDVTSALGTGVAILTADQKEVRYLLFDSKRLYYGPPQADVMRPILSLPLDPRWLHNILFDQTFGGKIWACDMEGGFLKECRNDALKLKIGWANRQGDKKTILIEHPKASVQINVLAFKSKVEDRKNLFVLEAPAGYQKLKVR